MVLSWMYYTINKWCLNHTSYVKTLSTLLRNAMPMRISIADLPWKFYVYKNYHLVFPPPTGFECYCLIFHPPPLPLLMVNFLLLRCPWYKMKWFICACVLFFFMGILDNSCTHLSVKVTFIKIKIKNLLFNLYMLMILAGLSYIMTVSVLNQCIDREHLYHMIAMVHKFSFCHVV